MGIRDETFFALTPIIRTLRDLRGGNSFSFASALAVLSVLLTTNFANAALLCVQLISDNSGNRSVPVHPGGAMRLTFRHSIYGSQVEELFALQREGFLLTQLRYGEARLVDFYGYENARLENGAWVVRPPPMLLPSLNLNTSAGAAITLHLDRHGDAKPLLIQPTGALRLTVASCSSSAHG
jgi:hypothetical protein